MATEKGDSDPEREDDAYKTAFSHRQNLSESRKTLEKQAPKGFLRGALEDSTWKILETVFLFGDALFALLFAADVTFRLIVLRSKFWLRTINWLDLAVSVTCVVEILVVILTKSSSNLLILRILRFARLARAIRVVAMSSHLASFQLLIKCLIACVSAAKRQPMSIDF